MSQVNIQTLLATTQKLKRAYSAHWQDRESQWASDVHVALGELATAIQDEVQGSEKSMKIVGEINPDFRDAPVTDRHIQANREQLIQLGEQVHQLRADLRSAEERGVFDVDQIRRRCGEIHDALESVRHEDNDFLQNTLNTNLGAGE